MSEKLTFPMIENITEDFYSHFCGIKLSALKHGTYFIPSEERDKVLLGQGGKYTVYILAKDDLCVVSYSAAYEDFFTRLKNQDADKIIFEANRHFKLKKTILMILQKETVFDYGNAKILRAEDYPVYEAFFLDAYPNAVPDGWLYDYFIEKSDKEYFFGYFLDNKLVSVCDAPDMPYMEGQIQHTGIHTLAEERKRGFAKRTVAFAVHHLIEIGVCPQYECEAENTASLALAESVGFNKYGEHIFLRNKRYNNNSLSKNL